MFDPSKLKDLLEVPTAGKKADPFSLEALIEWLEKQPGEKVYSWVSGCNCIIHQYLIAHDIPWNAYGKFLSSDERCDIAGMPPHTFGAALTRARALLGKS